MKNDADTFVGIFLYTLLIIGVYAVWNLLSASDKIIHCYVEHNYDKIYQLKGKIPWRHDIVIAEAPSLEEILVIANKSHCKLLSEPK